LNSVYIEAFFIKYLDSLAKNYAVAAAKVHLCRKR